MGSLQKTLDDTTYPPTHTFTISPLEATGLLAIRFGHLQQIAPTFFEGESLLDVGASKGFYSLWAASHGFKSVEAIEPQEQYVKLHQRIATELHLDNQINIHQEKFGAFCRRQKPPLLPRYDRVMVGNVPHYLFGEYGGHGWWEDVAALCCDGAQVVVEGPTDMRDANCFVPKLAPELEAQWNTGANLMAPILAGFELCGAVDSPRPASDRCLMLFVRRGRVVPEADVPRLSLESLPISHLWRETKTKKQFQHRIYQTPGGLLVKIDNTLAVDPEYSVTRLSAAMASPYSTSTIGFVYEGDRLVGWAELYRKDIQWYRLRGDHIPSRDDYRKLLRTICIYQVELANRGYLDLDNGAGNWGHDAFGRLYTCDKGAVHAISHEFNICQRAFEVPTDYGMEDPEAFRDGSFFRLAHREYSEWLTRTHERRICDAVQSGNILQIQAAFLQLYRAVGEKDG